MRELIIFVGPPFFVFLAWLAWRAFERWVKDLGRNSDEEKAAQEDCAFLEGLE